MIRKSDPTANAFTLTEMLVVIAIISMLAAMVVPTIGVMLERTKRGACAENLHNIYAGMLLYEREHEKQPRWMQHNLAHYGTSHLNFFGLMPLDSGYNPYTYYANINYQPDVGYSGLGKLIGSNDYLPGAPDPLKLVREAAAHRYSTLEKINNPHYKFCKSPQVFFCPSQTDPYMNDTWWKTRWDTFPFGRNYHANQICYSMRPGSNIQRYPNIEGDHGFVVCEPNNHWRIARWYSIQYPKNHFPHFERYAVASDATGSKTFVHTGHGDGANVAYNTGAVAYYEDRGELLSTYNNLSIWSYGLEYATRQVNIWRGFDKRFSP